MKLINSPNYQETINAPLIFLAGPIQGAYDWHSDAIKIISEVAPELYIASPKRIEKFEGEFATDKYAEQVDWETCHLNEAGRNGVVMFWLAKEFEHDCNRAYAQTTRFELAEWKVKHQTIGTKLVIGLEEGFTGSKYILRRFAQDCPEVPVLSTLEDTCKKAVQLAREPTPYSDYRPI